MCKCSKKKYKCTNKKCKFYINNHTHITTREHDHDINNIGFNNVGFNNNIGFNNIGYGINNNIINDNLFYGQGGLRDWRIHQNRCRNTYIGQSYDHCGHCGNVGCRCHLSMGCHGFNNLRGCHNGLSSLGVW